MHIASRYIEKIGFDHPIVLKTFELYLEKKLLNSMEPDFEAFKKGQIKVEGPEALIVN